MVMERANHHPPYGHLLPEEGQSVSTAACQISSEPSSGLRPPTSARKGSFPVRGYAIDVAAYVIKLIMDLSIGEADNGEAERFQVGGSLFVIGAALFIVVLSAIDFYNQQRFMTKEINNVIPDDILSVESTIAVFQAIIPKVTLFRSHVLSKHFSSFCQIWFYSRAIEIHGCLHRK